MVSLRKCLRQDRRECREEKEIMRDESIHDRFV